MFVYWGITEQMMWAIIACVVMMGFDILTGFMGACLNHDVQSSKMRTGIFHKATLIMIIVLAWLCELFVMHVPELGISIPLVIPACVLIFTMELVSITENIVIINPDLKDSKLIQLFENGEQDA